MAKIFKTCTEPSCKKDFFINDRAQEFYARQGFTLPKRCYECRQERKKGSTSHRSYDTGVNHSRAEPTRIGVHLTNHSEKLTKKERDRRRRDVKHR